MQKNISFPPQHAACRAIGELYDIIVVKQSLDHALFQNKTRLQVAGIIMH